MAWLIEAYLEEGVLDIVPEIKYIAFTRTKVSELKTLEDCNKKLDIYRKYKPRWEAIAKDWERKGNQGFAKNYIADADSMYKKISDRAKQLDPNKSIQKNPYKNFTVLDEEEAYKLYAEEARKVVKRLNSDKTYLDDCVDKIIKFFTTYPRTEEDPDIIEARKAIKAGKGLLVCDDTHMPEYLIISEWQDLSCAAGPHYLVANEVEKAFKAKKICPLDVSFGDGDEGCIYFKL